MRLGPESHVTPHIKLASLLKMGENGSIWTAYHDRLGREVAVKFLSAFMARDPARAARFSREAAITARIRSPHVVEVYEQGVTEDGTPYIVMELLRGERLADRLPQTGPLSVLETAIVVAHLCEALAEAHRLSIVHRDIRPDNVFLAEAGAGFSVKLLDFGVARADVDSEELTLTTTGAIVGTLVYMSPEQFFSPRDVDGRSDLWSVAVTAYQSLTGRSPFEHKGLEALLDAIRVGVFPLPGERRGDVPPEVDAWFGKALARRLADRFQTADEMAEAMRAAVRPRPAAPTGGAG